MGTRMSQEVGKWLVNGYNLLKNGVYWGYNPLILTIDPNFLGHPSRWVGRCHDVWKAVIKCLLVICVLRFSWILCAYMN